MLIAVTISFQFTIQLESLLWNLILRYLMSLKTQQMHNLTLSTLTSKDKVLMSTISCCQVPLMDTLTLSQSSSPFSLTWVMERSMCPSITNSLKLQTTHTDQLNLETPSTESFLIEPRTLVFTDLSTYRYMLTLRLPMNWPYQPLIPQPSIPFLQQPLHWQIVFPYSKIIALYIKKDSSVSILGGQDMRIVLWYFLEMCYKTTFSSTCREITTLSPIWLTGKITLMSLLYIQVWMATI